MTAQEFVALVRCNWCRVWFRALLVTLRGSHYCPVCQVAGNDKLPIQAYRRPSNDPDRADYRPTFPLDPALADILGTEPPSKGWSH